MRSLLFSVLLVISAIIPAYNLTVDNTCAFAQETKIVKTKAIQTQDDSKLYKVMIIVMIIWLGIGGYIFSIDRKVRKLENDINEL